MLAPKTTRASNTGQAGFTLVEVLVGLVVFSIVAASITALFTANLHVSSMGKARSLGLALANEKLEYLRNLPYDSVATQNGTIYPPGNVLDDENVTRNNYKFRVHTVAEYVDDPYDGNLSGTIPGKPTDLYPYDYKKAEVSVYANNVQVAILTANIAAKAAETSSNTGILSIKVIDAGGLPVAGATVHITNTVVNPDVDITTTTDINGLVVIPKLPPDSNGDYRITASLAGYSTDRTWPEAGGNHKAFNPDANILVQKITNVTLSIDRTANLTVNVVDTDGQPVNDVDVTVTGAKLTYTEPTETPKYSVVRQTDTNGSFTLSAIEWDTYSFYIFNDRRIVTTSPYQPTDLAPNSSLTITMVVSSSSSYPTIKSVSPSSDPTNSSSDIVITGTNFNSPTVKLKRTGYADITATIADYDNDTINATFDLTGAAPGTWDLVLTSGSKTVTQPGGFVVRP